MRTNGEARLGCEDEKRRPVIPRHTAARALVGFAWLAVFAVILTATAAGCVVLFRWITR